MALKPIAKRLDDVDAEAVRRSHAQAIEELQAAPAMRTRIIKDVVVPDNGTVLVAHGLGRVPEIVLTSPERGAAAVGVLGEGRVGFDRAKYIQLRANGFAAPITVDVEVK